MSCSRGNNKRNSWSNYQPDKNALNFKKGSDKRHLQLSQTPGCQELWIPAVFQAVLPSLSGHGHTCDLNRKSQNSVSAADRILGEHHYSWGSSGKRREEKNQRKKKKKRPKSMDTIYPSQVIPMPLQQNAVNIDFISTNKRIVRCFLRNNSYLMRKARATTFDREKKWILAFQTYI